MQLLDTFLCSLPRLLLALLLCAAGCRAAVGSEEQLEQFDLGLGAQGALVQACFQAHAWRLAFPEEKACVVILDEGWEKSGRVGRAAVVYTFKGQVRARDFRGSARVLEGVGAGELDKPETLKARLLALPPGDLPADTRDPEQILPDAQLRVGKHPQGRGFPVGIVGLVSKVTHPDGSSETITMPWLVCDFEGLHCLYRPGAGPTKVLQIPVNEVTGRTYVCVPFSDVPEALVFQRDFLRRQPGERAELLLNIEGLAAGPSGEASVVFTEGKKLRLFNHFLGTTDFAGHSSKDLAAPQGFAAELSKRLLVDYQNAFFAKRKAHVLTPPRYGDLLRFLGPVSPEALPGDTPTVQVLRLYQRLLQAGLSPRLVDRPSSPAGYGVSLEVNGQTLAYSPERGMYQPKPASRSQGGVDVQLRPSEGGPQNRAMPKLNNPNAGRATAFVPDEAFVHHLEEEVEKGKLGAARELAELLIEGRYVTKDVARGRSLLGMAADKGDAESALSLARMMNKEALDEEGKARLYKLYEIAAWAGFREAQYNLGAMTSSGRGCKRDYVAGLAWLIVARKNGMDGVGEAEIRAALAKKPELIAEAEGRSSELIIRLRELGSPVQ